MTMTRTANIQLIKPLETGQTANKISDNLRIPTGNPDYTDNYDSLITTKIGAAYLNNIDPGFTITEREEELLEQMLNTAKYIGKVEP